MAAKRRMQYPEILNGAVGATETDNRPLTRYFSLSDGSAVRIEILLSAKPSEGTVTVELQTGSIQDPNSTTDEFMWIASKTVDIESTSDDVVVLKIHPATSGDDAYLPLGFFGRLVVKSAADGTATVARIAVLQEE